jgi:hypothetical protein
MDNLFKEIVAVVGTVEFLKNFIKLEKNKWIWALVTVFVSVIYSLPFMTEEVFNAILLVTGSTLFYDAVYQTFKKKVLGE